MFIYVLRIWIKDITPMCFYISAISEEEAIGTFHKDFCYSQYKKPDIQVIDKLALDSPKIIFSSENLMNIHWRKVFDK